MNRGDVDAEWLLVAALVILGFAFLDAPTTPVEYATHGVVLVAAVLAVFDPIRERETFLAAAMVALLVVAAASMTDWYDRRTVVSIGLDGMFAMAILGSLCASPTGGTDGTFRGENRRRGGQRSARCARIL